MATLPSPTQVAGSNSAIYEAYYNIVDPNGTGTIGGMEAARFLKKSGLSDVILSKIWDLSDPGGRGCLDKTGMFVALKLVALVQNGKDLKISNAHLDVPPPKMGDIPLPKPTKPPPPKITNTPLITSLPPAAVDWSVKPAEREKYDKLFESLAPVNGLIPGNKVRNVLMESKLPLETLGKIWDLADQDQDGQLNKHEFIAAMHLVYKALEKHAIPSTLPPELMPPAKRKGSTPLASNVSTPLLNRGLDGVKPEIIAPVQPLISTAPLATIQPTINASVAPIKPTQPVQPTLSWVVTNDEKAKSDALFIKSDIDRDGFVSGHEIKDVFLQSGVPQPILAHIWSLCDIKQTGKLNNEQFALAMWLVARKLKGIDPPPQLTPEMVPPSFRSKPDGLVDNNNHNRYSNPELDMISKDIEELAREKLALETDIAQKEADIKIKHGEIKSLQSELDTLAATLKQLENQKGEAQKRLNDLKAQVDKLRTQANEQAELVAAQEAELNTKKQQLEGLKQEEERLEKLKQENANRLDKLTSNLQETQLCISQVKALITQLEEQKRQMNDAIQACDAAIESGDATAVPDTALRINPDFRDPEYAKVGTLNVNKDNGFEDDPFSKKDGESSGFSDDPFKNDPFKNQDAFSSNDPFNAAFSKPNDGFSSDPFGGSFTNNTSQADPFNAFGDSQKTTSDTQEEKDAFGCDPFAVLHAPTRDGSAPPPVRSTSPSPALPPKKSKQPPPRPAPPRPAQPPSMKKPTTDMFGGSDPFGSSSGGFADFTNFDAKFSNNSATTKPVQQPPQKQQQPTVPLKDLDFTDDPFRDYRYEDPFNITFDDDDDDDNGNPNAGTKRDTFPSKNDSSNNNNLFSDDKFDPFGLDNGRQSVPLPQSDPFTINNNRSKSERMLTKTLNEEEQLAWAARESLKLEEDRKKRLLQEQADLELAITLSKAESNQL